MGLISRVSSRTYRPSQLKTMIDTLLDKVNQSGYSWIFDIERIENDDEDFYESPLEKELEFNWQEQLNRIIVIILAPFLPHLTNSGLFNDSMIDSSKSLEGSNSQRTSEGVLSNINFKKYTDKTEIALIKDDPDFWTPLSIVFLFSMISIYSQIYVTSWIIIIWLFGSGLIFILARVLGGEFNYSLVLGVIGYCLLPIILTGFIGRILGNISSLLMHLLRCSGLFWSTASSSQFLASIEYKDKQILLAYPIFLLYVYFLHLYTGV